MRRIDSAKRARAFTSFPKVHHSAIAKLTGAHRKTVAKVRIFKGIADSWRVEASSRRARGRRQMAYVDEILLDGSVILYRGYRQQEFLCVGTSLAFIQRLGLYGRDPWRHEMRTIAGTHYRSVAWEAEKTAIATERPKYNTGGKLGE
jgi:hypothetical protein